jgi:hypothetical protein
MASAIHAPQPSYPTPSFSRDSTQSFTSSQKQLYGEVSSSQSLNSSPTKSPPPSRGHQKKMSFSMGTYAPQNGLHLQHNGPRGYGDVNGSISYQQYPGGQNPQIYTVCYISCLRLLSRDNEALSHLTHMALLTPLFFRLSILAYKSTKWR